LDSAEIQCEASPTPGQVGWIWHTSGPPADASYAVAIWVAVRQRPARHAAVRPQALARSGKAQGDTGTDFLIRRFWVRAPGTAFSHPARDRSV
jgi:hypothetical protein